MSICASKKPESAISQHPKLQAFPLPSTALLSLQNSSKSIPNSHPILQQSFSTHSTPRTNLNSLQTPEVPVPAPEPNYLPSKLPAPQTTNSAQIPPPNSPELHLSRPPSIPSKHSPQLRPSTANTYLLFCPEINPIHNFLHSTPQCNSSTSSPSPDTQQPASTLHSTRGATFHLPHLRQTLQHPKIASSSADLQAHVRASRKLWRIAKSGSRPSRVARNVCTS